MSPYLDLAGPIVLAHRGGRLEAPENSLAAVEHVLGLGLHYFETDVRATRDGVAVLMHDAAVDRTTDGRGLLADMDWADVARLRDASGAPPLRLEALLRDHPGLRLNIDAKEDRVLPALVRALIETRATDRVCLSSFSTPRLRTLRAALGPEVATSVARAEVARLVGAARLPGRARRRMLRELTRERSVVCVQVPETFRGVPVVTPRFVETVHQLGLALHIWTVNEPAEMRRLLDLGADGLVTDRPSVLKEILVERTTN